MNDIPFRDDQTPEEFVDACFRVLLRREPDSLGRRHHLDRLAAGDSRLSVVAAFAGSKEYRDRERANQWVPAGHFYSPMPSIEEVAQHKREPRSPVQFPAIDLQDRAQEKLMRAFAKLYPSIPFRDGAAEGLRYRYPNSSFPPGDAIPLHCMIRHLEPRRFIEVGSGNSSCCTLDTIERFLDEAVGLTLIEPYPEFFQSLVQPRDLEALRLLPLRLQDVPLPEFERLEARDILFIDSTHVSKLNSDVNHLFFEILPRLQKGVFVHIHDVFFPFEYPIEWLEEGRGWNEQYVLRAFLQYNRAFEIRFFNTYLYQKERAWFEANMPGCLRAPGGSIWLEKVL